MADLSAVQDGPAEDPKAGKSRPSSDVQFPYYDLAAAIDVASTIHNRAGGSCDREQLATMLGHKGVRSGAFVSKISAVKMFGLVDEEGDTVRLSRRGSNIVAQITEAEAKRAKVDAFLDVELFRLVYERYQGNSLPADVGLRNLLETEYGIVESRVGATVRVMLDSAEEAGFFEIAGNRTRMVKPLVSTGAAVEEPKVEERTPPDDPPPPERQKFGGGSGGSGGSGGGGDIDPAILGLLQRMPPGGTPISAKRRDEFIKAFTAVVSFIYPVADDDKRPQTESL